MIAVQSLTKRYGATVAVDGLTFSVRSGSILGFLGPNGAGKTTTLRVLLGLAEPTAGSATIDGRAYRSLPDPLASVGAVLDSSGFHPGRKGRNHLRVIARAAGLPVGRVDEVLRLVELGGVAGRRVKAYSFGMKQRLNPRPPSSATRRRWSWMSRPTASIPRGFAGSVTSCGRWPRGAHDSRVQPRAVAEVSQTVDEVVVIHRGRLRAQSTLAELTHRREGSGAVRVRSPEAGRLAELLRAAAASVEAPEPGRLSVRGASPEQVGDVAAENRIALHELVAESADASLEEVFLELTRDEEATAE